jgi:hypothetical protein
MVIVDACGYEQKRAGLNWEISQLVERVISNKLVVLTDTETDQIRLGRQFRSAWAGMSSTSPNYRSDAARIRFVVRDIDKPRWVDNEQPESKIPITLSEGGEAARKKHGRMKHFLFSSMYEQIPVDDRIMGLLMTGAPASRPSFGR